MKYKLSAALLTASKVIRKWASGSRRFQQTHGPGRRGHVRHHVKQPLFVLMQFFFFFCTNPNCF